MRAKSSSLFLDQFLLAVSLYVTAFALIFVLAEKLHGALAFATLFAATTAPGLAIAVRVEREVTITTLSLGFFFSYVLYGLAALVCRIANLDFATFYVLWIGLCFAIAFIVATRAPAVSRKWSGIDVFALCVVFSAIYFSYPILNDQGLLDSNILHSFDAKSFSPSNWDVAPFGLEEVQPRMSASLWHSWFAVFADVISIDPRALTTRIASPYLAIFQVLIMTALLWEITGRKLSPIFLFLAVILPVVLFHLEGGGPYWYQFRFLNGPTVDKDFAAFTLLPAALICVIKVLRGRGAATQFWFAAFVLSGVVLVYTHPMSAIYLLIGAGVVSAGMTLRATLPLALLVLAAALLLVLYSVLVVDPGSTHLTIEKLVQLDLQENRQTLNYWLGHYVAPWNVANSMREYADGAGRYIFRGYTVNSTVIWGSALAALIWVALCLRSRVMRATCARVHGISAVISLLSSAGGIGVLFVASEPLAFSSVGIALALLVIALISVAIAFFKEPKKWLPSEYVAMKVQALFMASFLCIFVISSLLVTFRPELWRGAERLHWGYFGFLPFAYAASHAMAMVMEVVGRQRLGAEPSQKGVASRGLAVLGVSALILAITITVAAWPPRTILVLTDIVPVQGHGFAMIFPEGSEALKYGSDSNEAPNKSRLVLSEDNRILGPGHSVHAGIFEAGQGRYSHWGNAILFASSDNTDPRSNQRVYALKYDFQLPNWLTGAGAGAGIAAVLGLLLFVGARNARALAPAHVAQVLATALLLDQAAAAAFDRDSLGRLVGLRPYVDVDWRPRPPHVNPSYTFAGACAVDFPPSRPGWMTETSRVLVFSAYFERYYAIYRPQFAYYRELYSEAFALEKLGDPFLSVWRGYHQLEDGQLGTDAVTFLRSRVTHIVLESANPVHQKLAQDLSAHPELRISRIDAPTPYLACAARGGLDLPPVIVMSVQSANSPPATTP